MYPSVVSGRQTTQWTPGCSWLHAPCLSQLAASRCQTALINPNDPRGELIRFLLMPNDFIFRYVRQPILVEKKSPFYQICSIIWLIIDLMSQFSTKLGRF